MRLMLGLLLCLLAGRTAAGELVLTVLGNADDPRVAAAREAVDFWNAEFARAGTDLRLRLGDVVASPVPPGFHASVPSGPAAAGMTIDPGDLDPVAGDILLAFPDELFVSFTHRLEDGRAYVAVRQIAGTRWNVPGIAANVIAHEIGHALGLRHGSDPTLLMCGRPADCEPSRFASGNGAIWPLGDEHAARLPRLARLPMNQPR